MSQQKHVELRAEDRALPVAAAPALAGKLPRLVDEPAADRWIYGLLALLLVAG